MTKHQTQITTFVLSSGQACPKHPTVPDEQTRKLRIRLIAEELCELADALGVWLEIIQLLSGEYVILTEIDKSAIPNLTYAADATGDLRYVVTGTDCAMGIDGEPIDEEIHRSNMSKFIDGSRRPDGKWVKGPSYSPANLQPIIDAQK
jgi:predicted HAD superfamily Cof-like phosphohydrolase